MAYVSLYRKYRPQTFDEVVGQPHVTRSLVNALRDDRVHHAYLFAGPRGTGKTSTARILAKSVNCVQGPTPEPCNTCDQCVAITTGTSVDVIEMDMASHGGVDDARELRDRAQFAPASARRKVYILDEVHMASTAAFNALLKLVEEPPAHVLFAMATTDPQKVLPTILSRVQRLDLRRVGAADVAGRVRDLVQREGAGIDDAAVDLVVRAGDGSVRDTESVLEQVLAYADGDVTGDDVAEVLGQTSFDHTAAAVDAVLAGDLAAAFAKVQDLLDDGTDLRQFTLDLVGHVRDLLVLVVAPGRDDLVDATADRLLALQAQAARSDRAGLAVALDELATALEQMRQGPARLAVELALARIATRPGAPAVLPVAADPTDGGSVLLDETAPGRSGEHGPGDPTPRSDPDVQPGSDPDEPTTTATGSSADGEAVASDDDPPELAGAARDVQADPRSGDPDPQAGEPGTEPDLDLQPDPDAQPDPDVDAEARDQAGPSAEDTVAQPDDPDRDGGSDLQADARARPDDDAAVGGDAATRARARADRVARDGMPDLPSERPPGPEVEVAEPAVTDAVEDLDAIRTRWDAILELVRVESRRCHAIFEPAQVRQLRNGVLVLGYGERYRSFHAGNATQAAFSDVLRSAVEQATGVRVRIDVRVDGDGPPRPIPRPVDAESDVVDAPASGGELDRASTGARATTATPTVVDPAIAEPPPATPTPLADVDPAEAMDRAAAALVDGLGATELAADD